jgi:DNA-binding CsgD family transcriptional regulator
MIARILPAIFPAMTAERRAMTLAAIIVLQSLCAIFFIGDVFFDVSEGDHLDDIHLALEAISAIALTIGVLFLMHELRDLLNRMTVMDVGIRAARGDMAALIDSFFQQWKLTPSERDVALLILKGINNDAIAKIRGTAPSTVRAQSTQIYAKADVDGRAQLISLFMEELLNIDMG